MTTCQAAGCNVFLRGEIRFCGPHRRAIPIDIRRRMRYGGHVVLMQAIKAVASKEGKTKLYQELEMAQDR